ncbi:MAG: hypothetical protein HY722_09385 [Planctomycetes bacterium]|nr:hypothetical protein [Planctomycetota bacterium]
MHRPALAIVFALAALVPGTAHAHGGDEAIWGPLNALVDHDQAVVRWPATAGAVAGGLAGVPATVVLLPVTVPLAAAGGPGDGGADLLPLAPLFLCAEAGALAVGGVPWLIFGWW